MKEQSKKVIEETSKRERTKVISLLFLHHHPLTLKKKN
jgi:hypothetical protein